jgi:hypothetical protein
MDTCSLINNVERGWSGSNLFLLVKGETNDRL